MTHWNLTYHGAVKLVSLIETKVDNGGNRQITDGVLSTQVKTLIVNFSDQV